MSKEQQFTKDYDRYLNLIFIFFYSKTHNREAAKRLAQETFLEAWKEINANTVVSDTKALLYEKAKMKLAEWNVNNEAAAEKVAAKHGSVLSQLEKLSEDDQQLIVMRFIDGLSPKAISKYLKRSEDAIAVMVQRAVSRLQNV